MGSEGTRESQYEKLIELHERRGQTPLGLIAGFSWEEDPRHLLFAFARYKFVAKMMSGRKHVLEIGCGDGMGARLVLQEVSRLTAVDFDPIFIRDIESRMTDSWRFECAVHDILDGPKAGNFDGIYSLDVLEHIQPSDEHTYMQNIVDSLQPHGAFIVGMPSLQSQQYASELSKAGHVNCKKQGELRDLCLQYFHNVFCFSMNDEVVHTGYHEMAHYVMALCCGKRS